MSGAESEIGRLILAGDVGGTKTHLGLYHMDQRNIECARDYIYATSDFESLSAACADFLSKGHESIRAACFGVAGPVIDGRADATNISWQMSEETLREDLSDKPVKLINDLAATAYGMIHLPESEFQILQRGKFRLSEGDVAVIAAGTGLGESALVSEGPNYYVVASEGGHADFAPRNEEQYELWKYIDRKFDHVSIERVLSGPGLFNIHSFLRAYRQIPEPEWLTARMAMHDPSAVISEVALERRDECCVHALEMFVDIYGAEAGNLALKVLATGGVYLGGGIAPKVLPALTDGRFVRAFTDKGRLREMLSKIEVRVSLNQGAGILGAAYYAAALL